MNKLLISLLLGVMFFLGCSDSSTSPLVPDVSENEKTQIEQLVNLVNEHRKQMGLEPLIWNDEIAYVAQMHSEDMYENNYLAHVDKSGNGPSERLNAHTDKFTTIGENIALGYKSGSAVFSGWIASTVHKEIIENASFTHHGVGYVEEGNYWTHVFAKLK